MLAIISPAKKLDLDPLAAAHKKLPFSEPELLADAVTLQAVAKKLTAKKLAALMDLSEALAELNFDRFQAWQPVHSRVGVNDAKPAVLMFAGDVYGGLDAGSLDAKALTWAQEHLAILSGLYGVLRPLDLIQPYRLEMGSKLKTRRGKDLYQFWGERIAHAIDRRAANHRERVLVNLASSEYMKSVPRRRLDTPIVTMSFKEVRDDKTMALMLFAKRARGMMARYIIAERVDRLEGLKDFGAGDYRYDPALSTADEWVFTRPYRTMAMEAEDD